MFCQKTSTKLTYLRKNTSKICVKVSEITPKLLEVFHQFLQNFPHTIPTTFFPNFQENTFKISAESLFN